MKITCENQNSEKLEFGWFPPLWIQTIDGIGTRYNVSTSKNSGQDSENYNGATAEKRNINIVFSVKESNYVEQRNRLYNFFQPRSEGTLYYDDAPVLRKIGYYVENIEPSGEGMFKNITLSLICPDPKFYAIDEEMTSLAMWEGRIRFPLRIPQPFVVTKKVNTLIGNVRNGSNVTQGLTIKFTATGTVVNPSLYDINRHTKMQINLTMHSGDIVTVTTGSNNKHVKLTGGGVTSNINNLMAYPPVWLQAYQGDNLFRYDAEQGIDNLNVSILHTQAYWGA
jgi:hypothetical protein